MLEKLQDKVYFHIQNGDFIYEEKRNYRVEEWLGQVGLTAPQAPRIVNLAPGIVGVWENYKLYLERGKALAAWHRNVPAFFTFDDHEILDNIDGTSVFGRRNRRSVFRDIGTQAWYDYLGWANPIPPGAIHFGQAQLKAGSDILTDPQADFSTLGAGLPGAGPAARALGRRGRRRPGARTGRPARRRGRPERQRLPGARTPRCPSAPRAARRQGRWRGQLQHRPPVVLRTAGRQRAFLLPRHPQPPGRERPHARGPARPVDAGRAAEGVAAGRA